MTDWLLIMPEERFLLNFSEKWEDSDAKRNNVKSLLLELPFFLSFKECQSVALLQLRKSKIFLVET